MNSFLYFLPGVGGGLATHRQMKAAGLGYAFPREDGQCPTAAWESEGPERQRGLMVVYGPRPKDVSFAPDKQCWMRLNASAWLGMAKDTEARPTAADLRRKNFACEGYGVELGDGAEWRVPVVRLAAGGTMLPRVLVLENGVPRFRVRSEYLPLFNCADALFANEIAGGQAHSADELLWLAEQALQINYRVSRAELSLLELIDTENIRKICDALLDGPKLRVLIEEWKSKKNAPSPIGAVSPTGVTA